MVSVFGPSRSHIACVFPSSPGRGGLGRLSADVMLELRQSGHLVHAVGPRPVAGIGLDDVDWSPAPAPLPRWLTRYTPLRWRRGDLTYLMHRRLGAWAAREVKARTPAALYAFSEVALETLRWNAPDGRVAILDNPTADVRHFREVSAREHARWAGGKFVDHPSQRMVERSVREYELADRIRVASTFSKATMTERGIPAEKIDVVPYPIDVHRFVPRETPITPDRPLRVSYVAAITPAKGFQYLLEAARQVGPRDVQLELVGGTTSRTSRLLFASLRQGLDVVAAPVQNLVEAYHRAELFVLPTLHDGYGFVVPEAMACGLPVVVTESCGAKDLVNDGETGWIVPAGDTNALAAVLRAALTDRDRLRAMGAAARASIVRQAEERAGALGAWLAQVVPAGASGAGDRSGRRDATAAR